MKPTLYAALLLLWLLAGCAPEAAPDGTGDLTPAQAAANQPTSVPDGTQVGKLGTLLNEPVPTRRAVKPAPPLPNELPTVTTTVVATRGSVLAALLPTLTPTPAVTPRAEVRFPGSVGDVTVNVRGGPGTNYPIVGKVSGGMPFEIVGRTESGDWLRICCITGAEGENWISAEFLAPRAAGSRSLSDLPIATIPPTPEAPPAAAGDGGGGADGSAAALAAAPAEGLPGSGNFSAPGGINPLTGLPGGSGGRPIIVCINNDYAARPQLGIGQADVVYEYLMEGYGITRFSAIFMGSSGQVGPVRSARLINYYMGALYDAGLVCSGASDPVRYALKHQAPFPYMDIDLDDASNINYSVSIGGDYRTRLRTNTDQLRRWLADWGVEKAPSIRGFTFGGVPGGGVPAVSISIPYPSGTGSQVAYRYDGAAYLRSLGGAPHLDGNTGMQVAVENVIVQVAPHETTNIVEDSLGSTSIRLNLFGSGPAIVFRDGQAFVGAWRSESRGDTPRFYDSQGAEIPLKPGRSWISVVPSTYTISYQ